MKKRTRITDISPVGPHLTHEHLASVIGGFVDGGRTTNSNTLTLNINGGVDSCGDVLQ